MASFDVIVAGGGVAGLSASLFLARAQMSVAVFDREQSSLRRVERVDNYLGFPEGIAGIELLERGRRQAERFGAQIFTDDVATVRACNGGFDVGVGAAAHRSAYFVLASNKRTDLATALGLPLGGFGGRFVSVSVDGATALDRCYAAGRITGTPSQAIISAGEGAKVAIAIVQRQRGGYYVDHD